MTETEVLRLYNDAADKFIQKVKSGQARSVETYRELKAAREAARSVQMCTSPCVDNYCPVHGIAAEKEKKT